MTRARSFRARAIRRCALISAVGVAVTACTFVLVRGDVDRLDRQRVEGPATQALLGVQHFMALVDQVMATANGVVAASGIDAQRFTAVLGPDVKAGTALAGLALVLGEPNGSRVVARVGDTHLLGALGTKALVPTPASTLVAFESAARSSDLGFAARAGSGRAAVFLEVAIPANVTPGAPFALVTRDAAHHVVVGTGASLAGLTRSNQTVAFGGRSLTLLVGAGTPPAGVLGMTLPELVLVAGVVLTLLAIAVGLALARRDETVRSLGVENLALDQALERQRVIEAELRASQERFRTVLRDSPDVIALFDVTEGTCEILNRSDVFGHTIDAVQAPGGLYSLFAASGDLQREDRAEDADASGGDDAAAYWARLRALGPEQVSETTLRLRDADGASRRVRVRFSPLSISDDQDAGADAAPRLLGSISDVTEQWNTELRELELQEALRRSQRLEAVGQLAGGVAHDFNNLLAAIMASAELLSDDVPAGRPREYADEIQRSAARGAALVRQLLTFAQRDRAEPRVVDLNEIVTGMEPLLRRSLGGHVQLQMTTSECSADIVGDPTHLEQVILNLAVNARDAMPDGGVLWIATAIDFDDEAPQNDRVVLSVTDTGTGISPEVRDRIFEPFVSTKDPGKGTGLGLSTVQSIVTAMDGRIEVLSKVGQGTTFEISFARCFDAPEPAETAAREADVFGAGRRILLVEDDAAVRHALEHLLQRLGFDVTTADNGAEALRTFEQRVFDLVLTDAVMPGISGRELIAHLRQMRPALPVILASGYNSDAPAEPPGGDDAERIELLRKPFTTRELTTALRAALDPAPAEDSLT